MYVHVQESLSADSPVTVFELMASRWENDGLTVSVLKRLSHSSVTRTWKSPLGGGNNKLSY